MTPTKRGEIKVSAVNTVTGDTINEYQGGYTMTWGRFPVYCQTPPSHCTAEELLLGVLPLNTKVQCPVCGRWSMAERTVSNERST